MYSLGSEDGYLDPKGKSTTIKTPSLVVRETKKDMLSYHEQPCSSGIYVQHPWPILAGVYAIGLPPKVGGATIKQLLGTMVFV
jgi:hypothetical protein